MKSKYLFNRTKRAEESGMLNMFFLVTYVSLML